VPTVVKNVLLFRATEGYGWSEVHYWLSGSDNPNLSTRIDVLTNVVGPARAAILGTGCDIVGVRASYPRAGVIASRASSVFIDGYDDQDSASQSASLAVVFIDTTSTRKKICHLRGFWDTVEENQMYNPNSGLAPGWQDRFVNWKNVMVQNGFGWLSKSATGSTTGQVVGYTSDADDRVTFNLATVVGPVLIPGSVFQMKFARINNSNSVLNRSLKVEVITATTVKTVAPIATGPFTGQGTFSTRVTEFVPYADTASVSLGERRMGKVTGHYPGRAKARART
jgi:hypothetical protein